MRYSLALLAAFLPVILAEECAPLHFIYARATTEPPQPKGGKWSDEGMMAKFDEMAAGDWSKGYGAAGASLFFNVTKLLPGTTGYPVHYPASFGESAPLGVKDMLAQLAKQSKACPNQKFALGGHSQGGFVTNSTIHQAPKEILDKVVAVAMFGSPACSKLVEGRCNSYCNKGDTVCDKPEHGALIKGTDCAAEDGHVSKSTKGAHMAYNADGYYVEKAACFVVSQFKKAAAPAA